MYIYLCVYIYIYILIYHYVLYIYQKTISKYNLYYRQEDKIKMERTYRIMLTRLHFLQKRSSPQVSSLKKEILNQEISYYMLYRRFLCKEQNPQIVEAKLLDIVDRMSISSGRYELKNCGEIIDRSKRNKVIESSLPAWKYSKSPVIFHPIKANEKSIVFMIRDICTKLHILLKIEKLKKRYNGCSYYS